ncbi:MAG TPA: MFS transporter [Pseudonocardiaceae bacterium]|nr:MFS transporter [Pseudonocardiaceae bacterium]
MGDDRRRGGLWRHRDFRLLWIGETTSSVGDAVTTVALPLVAITVVHASTFTVGVLSASAWLPWLGPGLVAGAWVDRVRRRRLMMACDAVSMLVLLSVPVATWFGVLTVGQLVAVALLVGASSMLFSTAYVAFLPTMVSSTELVEGNVKLAGSRSAAQIAGPGIAGLLAQVVGAAAGLLADAATYVVSAVCLLVIERREPPSRPRHSATNMVAEIGAGLRLVMGDRYLRALAVFSAMGNLALTGWHTLEVVFLVRVVGVSSGTVGLMLAIIGVGGVCGAFVTGAVIRRIGSARGVMLCSLGTTPFGLLIPLTGPGARLALFAVGGTVVSAGLVVTNIIARSFQQSYCPAPLLGRITASVQAVSRGVIPLGAILAGILGTVVGPRNGLWIATATLFGAALVLFAGPIRHNRDLPTSPPTELLGQDVRVVDVAPP